MGKRRLRLLLADDHPLMLEGLRKLLEPEFEVTGTVADGHQLVEAAEIQRPDLVVTDISMPGIDGIEATRRLGALVPAVRVLILSIHAEPSWVRAAFDAGARGYLTKISAPEEIENAVRAVLEGNFYVSPTVTGPLLGPMKEDLCETRPARPMANREPLTPRERDIVRLVGQGLRNKDIAHRLGVSVTTVRTHLSSVYDKLDSGSRVELALYAAHA